MRAGLAAILIALPRCAPSIPHTVDLEAPRVVGTSLPGDREVSPTTTIVLRFSKELAPQTVGESTFVVLPHELLLPCASDLDCVEGTCHRRRCQRAPITAAWLSDLAHPPLSPARLARAARFSVFLEAGGATVTMEPLAPLAPLRLHTLLVAPTVADLAANPLARDGAALPLRAEFATGEAERGRPQLLLVSPPDGASDVPSNLARVVARFSKPVAGVAEANLWLEGPASERLPTQLVPGALCAASPSATCYELRLRQPLPPLQIVRLRVSSDVRDSRGQSVLGGPAPSFASGAGPDHAAPKPEALLVQRADGCLVARLQSGEATDAILRSSWGAVHASIGAVEHEVWVPAPPLTSGTFELRLRDLAGNEALVNGPVEAAPKATVAITEVLANPAGPEPAQELVELQNVSPLPVDLGAWILDVHDDGANESILPAAILGPGQYAVVVGPTYDSASGTDPPPAPGSLLVRLGKSLGRTGLANSGGRIVLRDGQRRLISAYGSHYSVATKAFDGRSVERLAATACDVRGSWRPNPDGRSTPGAPPRPLTAGVD
jgi:hypothetical protein